MFGGWTSASRKAMLPVVERDNGLLFYPVQYEGLEASQNIYYTGATTNQQIIPAMDYLKAKGVKKLFLAGSDYVFPRTANKIIKQYAEELGIEIVGEEYVPLGDDWTAQVGQDRSPPSPTSCSTPSTARRTSASSRAKTKGMTAATRSRSSRCRSPRRRRRHRRRQRGRDSSPPGTTSRPPTRPANTKFIKAFQAKYGADRPTATRWRPATTRVYLCKAMVEKAGVVRRRRR